METEITIDNVKEYIQKTKELYDNTQQELIDTGNVNNEKYNKCIESSGVIIRFMDELNTFALHRLNKEASIIYYISADLLMRVVGVHTNRTELTEREKGLIYTSIVHYQKVLYVDPFHESAKEMYKTLHIFLTMFNNDASENLILLKRALSVQPCDYQLQFNLAFTYQRLNDLENAMIHFKLTIGLLEILKTDVNKKEIDDFMVKCLNGIGSLYFSLQDRDTANYFFYKALELSPDDPDINNQLGVVFTQLRFTDKAIMHYKHGIKNADKAIISGDKDMLLASMHMNMGLAYCYEINYPKAIESYNTALKYKPRLSLAYQNKLLDMNYISHLIDDPMYISNLHKNINKIYEKVVNDYKVALPNYKINKEIIEWNGDKNKLKIKRKINLGFVSGDFICHPVSYFLNGILKYLNYDIFNVTCYTMKIINLESQFPNISWKVINGTSPEELKSKIQNDTIDILFDLSTHTGDNRMDTFVLKPAPIQISYCGYPNTSGISNMDYHIVDKYTDSDGISPGPGGIIRESTQKYYSEKLLFMPNSFLSYTSSVSVQPILTDIQPVTKNGYLTIGTFNRYNKINDTVVELWEKILIECPTVRFVIKTKEFCTEKLKKQFINTFKNKKILERINILEYTDTYEKHLLDYNDIDIGLDTFPYSGTTTSAEALMMGVPIITMFDQKRQYHCQNVTSSLMINSSLSEFVVFNENEFINKIKYYSENLSELKNLKINVRNKFINGHVCNYTEFVSDFENLLLDTYKNHKW